MQNIADQEVIRQLQAGLSDKSKAEAFIANIQALASALNADIIMEIEPETVNRNATSDGWTRTVTITFKDSEGNVMTWLTETFTGALSIADTSTAGTASLPDGTDLVVEKGVATVKIDGDAQDWLAGETDTLTVSDVTPQQLNVAVTGGTSVQTFV